MNNKANKNKGKQNHNSKKKKKKARKALVAGMGELLGRAGLGSGAAWL